MLPGEDASREVMQFGEALFGKLAAGDAEAIA